MRKSLKRKRASPWLIFSALCFVSLIALIAAMSMMMGAVNSVVSNPRSQPAEEQTFEVENPFEYVDWDYWLAINPDVIAWVTVPGTSINHAIVQAPSNDPTYYLTHDVYRNWNPHGCPYVDADCDGLSGFSTYIFGHNMGYNDSMFADFAKFSSPAYALEHRTILLQTPTEQTILQVSAADIVSGYEQSKRSDFEDEIMLSAWYETRFEVSDMQIENDAEAEKLITFVTCSYNYFSNERTLVYSQPKTERNVYDDYTD